MGRGDSLGIPHRVQDEDGEDAGDGADGEDDLQVAYGKTEEVEMDILQEASEKATSQRSQSPEQADRNRPGGHVEGAPLSRGQQAVEQGGDADADTREDNTADKQGQRNHIIGIRPVEDPEEGDQHSRNHQDLQHRLAAEAVDQSSPEPVSADAGDHEDGVEDGYLGVGDMQTVQHEDAVERSGYAHGEGPQPVEQHGSPEVGVLEGLQEGIQAGVALFGLLLRLGIRGAVEGQVAKPAE